MRPLTEEETKSFFEKLAKYIGKHIKSLIDRPDGEFCFRLHRDRVYYLNSLVLQEAMHVSHDHLVAMGVCFGKFTKKRHQFRLHITALDYLAQYAKYKIWIKPNGEMSYLYGNDVLKSHLGRITENTPKGEGVVFFNMSEIPLGFGIAKFSTAECRKVAATEVIAFHQEDIGSYLRIEEKKEHSGGKDEEDEEESV